MMKEVVERLIEILNWKNHHEKEIQRVVMKIIAKLVRKNRNCIRVASIGWSMESIASLLYESKKIKIHSRYYDSTNNLHRKYEEPYLGEYKYSVFSLLGIRILQSLAKDHLNCAKIGNNKDLLPNIKRLTKISCNTPESEIKTTKLTLQLVRMLASSTGLIGVGGGKIPPQQRGSLPFCKSQLDSQTFGVASLMGLWTHYYSKLFVWISLKLKNKERFWQRESIYSNQTILI